MKTLLLTISLLCSCFSFSQKNIFELNYELGKASILTAPFHFSEYSYFAIKEKARVHRIIINRDDSTFNYTKEESKNSPVSYNNTTKIIGSITGKNKSFNALFDTESGIIFFEIADLINNTSSIDDSIIFYREQFIGITQQDDVFIIAGHERKSKSLNFYYKKQDHPIRLKKIDFSFIQPKYGASDIRFFLDEAAIIDDNTVFDPALLTKEIKLYLNEPKIIATCNQQYLFTQVAEIDTATGLADVKKINFEERFSYKNVPDPLKSNSFYRKNYLYTGAAYVKSLLISVIDLKSGLIVKKYEADRDDTISFKNTAIYQDGGNTFFVANSSRELSPKQFIRKINDDELFINARDAGPSETELMIGSYKKITERGSAPGISFPMSGSLPGGERLPVSFYMGFTPGFSTSWSKTIYMKSLLQKDNFEHISRALPVSIQESRELFEKELPKDHIRREFRSFYTEYLFIYAKDDKKLSVIEFKK